MCSEDIKKQLKEKFKIKREHNKNKKIKSFSDLNIHIDKDVIKLWRETR